MPRGASASSREMSAPRVRRTPYAISVASARSRTSSCGFRSISASSAAAAYAPSRSTRSRTRAATERASATSCFAATLTEELPHLARDHVPALFDVVLECEAHEQDDDSHADDV